MAVSRSPGIGRAVVEGFVMGEPGAAKGKGDWELVVHLMPWMRRGETKPSTTPLRLVVPVQERALEGWFAKLDDGSAIRAMVNGVKRTAGTRSEWTARGEMPIARLRATAVGPALRAARAALDAPVVVEDRVLGTLALEREYNWFSGARSFRGRRYQVSIERSGSDDDRVSDRRDISRAARRVLLIERRMKLIRETIARDKLPLYNDNWRGRRKKLDARGFVARIGLSSAVVRPDGSATLYFDDGDLFLRHLIEVRLNRNGSVSEICLAG